MNWRKLFAPSEIFTESDKAELEKLEASTAKLRALSAKIDQEWPASTYRLDRLRELAGALAEDPDNAELYRRLEITACMPSALTSGYQHRDIALGRIGEKIEEIMAPESEIVRRVLRRALEKAEAELRKVEASERKTAEAEQFDYVPSGKVLALQGRVLALRNGVAQKYKSEGAVQNPEGWRVRLAEFL